MHNYEHFASLQAHRMSVEQLSLQLTLKCTSKLQQILCQEKYERMTWTEFQTVGMLVQKAFTDNASDILATLRTNADQSIRVYCSFIQFYRRFCLSSSD